MSAWPANFALAAPSDVPGRPGRGRPEARRDFGGEGRHGGSDLLRTEALRQVAFEHLEFGRLLGDQVAPAAGLELRDESCAA